jgi:hypothetical protein
MLTEKGMTGTKKNISMKMTTTAAIITPVRLLIANSTLSELDIRESPFLPPFYVFRLS